MRLVRTLLVCAVLGAPLACRDANLAPLEMPAAGVRLRGDFAAGKTYAGHVRVESVRTANYQGKWRRVGRSLGRKPAYKKAVVRLAEGDSIDVYEGI